MDEKGRIGELVNETDEKGRLEEGRVEDGKVMDGRGVRPYIYTVCVLMGMWSSSGVVFLRACRFVHANKPF